VSAAHNEVRRIATNIAKLPETASKEQTRASSTREETVNLAEFEETLSEILTGIRAAQKREGGDAIGAGFVVGSISGSAIAGTSNLFRSHDSGIFTVVDFDVSVAAETTKRGKGGIRVMSIGAEGGAERKSHETSRVKFAVQIRIPEDGPAKRTRGF
jgi:Trypsin-co-occurring domain 2